MNDENIIFEKICDAFPFLRDAGKDVREDVTAHAQIARIPKGTFIFFEGDACQAIIILEGQERSASR